VSDTLVIDKMSLHISPSLKNVKYDKLSKNVNYKLQLIIVCQYWPLTVTEMGVAMVKAAHRILYFQQYSET
jgi:hypothetical protein